MPQNTTLFHRYVAVDWSANGTRKRGKNSIWIADLDPKGALCLKNPPTRNSAMEYICRILDEVKPGERMICGFDFSFGYPEGTARMLANHFDPIANQNWNFLWKLIKDKIEDAPDNQNNHREVAVELNDAFCGHGPFWIQGKNRRISIPEGLPRGVPRNKWGVNLPPFRRYNERVFPGQDVWNVYGRGSVGGQALLGIARLEQLRQCRNDVEVWPFETSGEGKHHVMVEIYPSLIEPIGDHMVLDARQVHAVAVRMMELDQAGILAERLQAPAGMPDAVRNEEGLFLDIT